MKILAVVCPSCGEVEIAYEDGDSLSWDFVYANPGNYKYYQNSGLEIEPYPLDSRDTYYIQHLSCDFKKPVNNELGLEDFAFEFEVTEDGLKILKVGKHWKGNDVILNGVKERILEEFI